MKRNFIYGLIFCLVVFGLIACKDAAKITVAPEAGTDVKPDTAKGSPFGEVVTIFKGFEELVEQNKISPSKGVEACNSYAERNIPRIRSLEQDIKKYETSPEYLDRMIATNKEIKEISNRVTKVVTDYYGIEGAGVLMKLSDMALARL